jgi:hypothetical protein
MLVKSILVPLVDATAVLEVRTPTPVGVPSIIGLVNVLLVSVSVVARPTRVSVDVGKVSVPVLTIEAMFGVVNVLLVSVWVALSSTAWLAGYVTKTFFVPAEKLTKLPPLLDSRTVVLASVVPDAVYVPNPVSQFVPSVMQ